MRESLKVAMKNELALREQMNQMNDRYQEQIAINQMLRS